MKFIISFTFSLIIVAQSQAEPLQLRYPELMVTPRASDRIKMEADNEQNNPGRWYKTHTPIQLASLMSLITGTYVKNNEPAYDSTRWSNQGEYRDDIDEFRSQASFLQLNGVAWLALTTYMSYNYTPYTDADKALRKLPVKSKRDHLTRERIAEEHLYDAYIVGQRMSWIFAVSNFAFAMTLQDMTDESSSNEAKLLVPITAIASFLPIFIKYRSYEVYQQHETYKKKIYGPVASPSLLADNKGRLAPGLQLTFNF
ncbi:MAG: hypothetical protein R2827_10075 [Bdellovibrionales bacterium]